jgi:hypothetical protein
LAARARVWIFPALLFAGYILTVAQSILQGLDMALGTAINSK